jgi:hypothetical protein
MQTTRPPARPIPLNLLMGELELGSRNAEVGNKE